MVALNWEDGRHLRPRMMETWMEVAGIKAEPRISLGNVLTLVGLIAAVAVAWGSLDGRVDANDEQLEENEKKIEALSRATKEEQRTLKGIEIDQADVKARVRGLERSVDANSEKLDKILDELRRPPRNNP